MQYDVKTIFARLKHRLLRALKRFLRTCYRLGPGMCCFIGGVVLFTVVGVVLILTVPKARARRAETAAIGTSPALTASLQPITTPGAGDPSDPLTAPDPNTTQDPDATATPEPTATPDVTLKKGDRGEEVTTLQSKLMKLGYLDIDEPTDYYGNATKAAIQLFQRQHELEQDGIAGAATQQILLSDDAKPYVMYEGAEGQDIEDFQELLYDLGYLTKKQITGYYGSDTVKAVKNFQKRNKLSQDGKAGTKTMETINSDEARVSYSKELEIAAERKAAEERARAQTAEGRIDKMISIAKKQLGKPYVLGARGPEKFDCSGLVYYCLRQVDVYTRRLNASGFSKTSRWTNVSSLDNVKRGDLLFFRSDGDSSVGHVGIYVGSGEMIDASSANGKVVRRSAKSSYWRRNFVNARRPIE